MAEYLASFGIIINLYILHSSYYVLIKYMNKSNISIKYIHILYNRERFGFDILKIREPQER